MKFTADAKSFAIAIRVVATACPARTPQEILQAIKVECGEHVSVLATDNMQTICCKVSGAVVHEPGSALLPSKRVAQIATMVSGVLEISADNNSVRLSCGTDDFRMGSEEPRKHPAKSESFADPTSYHLLNKESLAAALRRVAFANNVSNGRYAIGGTALDMPVDGGSYVIGTDGNRMACAKISGESVNRHACDPAGTVVPVSGIKVLMSALDQSESENVKVSGRASDVLVFADDFAFSSRLLDGRFPSPWKRLFGGFTIGETHGIAKVECCELLDAVRKTAIMTDEATAGALFKFLPDKLIVSKEAATIGSSLVEIPIECSGSSGEMKFRERYLREWLSVLPGHEMITIQYPLVAKSKILFQTDDKSSYVISYMDEVQQ